MVTPYSTKPATSFWRRGVANVPATAMDPVIETNFTIGPTDAVATAGSCFAQHISAALRERGFTTMMTEAAPLSATAQDENYGVFTARFGNIYTVRQLLQLLNRAYGLFSPGESAWIRADGRFIDPFRPLVQSAGFDSPDAVQLDRAAHLEAVRRMFEDCNVFVFTLGLTEAWESVRDGAIFPLVPQAVAHGIDAANYRFHNFTVAEMTADLTTFIKRLRRLNPTIRIILTVSPVALIATFEDRHVLVSNTYSKAALRVVADEISRGFPDVAYFPSFEIVTGPQARSAYLAEDLREIRPEGVAHVMSVFGRHYLNAEGIRNEMADREVAASDATVSPAAQRGPGRPREEDVMRTRQVICDEAVIETSA